MKTCRDILGETDPVSNIYLAFAGRGKPEYPENLQTQPTCDIKSGNQTRATLVEGQSVLSPL